MGPNTGLGDWRSTILHDALVAEASQQPAGAYILKADPNSSPNITAVSTVPFSEYTDGMFLVVTANSNWPSPGFFNGTDTVTLSVNGLAAFNLQRPTFTSPLIIDFEFVLVPAVVITYRADGPNFILLTVNVTGPLDVNSAGTGDSVPTLKITGDDVQTQPLLYVASGTGSFYYQVTADSVPNIQPRHFADLPVSPIEGSFCPIIDSNVTAFGAIVASGGGSNHVLAYYDGDNWTVMAV